MRTSHLQYPETMPKIQLLRQPYAGALSKDEIQSLEELDSERLSANWHLSSSLDLAQIEIGRAHV